MKIDNPRMNLYRKKKIGDSNLLVTDQGQWCFVGDDLLSNLKNNKILPGTPEFSLMEEKGVIVTDNNISGIIKRQRTNYLHLFMGTSLHIIVPTIRCNHKCVYCHSNAKDVSSKGFDMDVETARKVVDFVFQSSSDAITIEFQGGEPLLQFDVLQEIISYAKAKNKISKKDLRFDLVSNLSLLDHDILKYLIKEEIGICTSLDGPKEVHDKNRLMMGGSSHKETTYWINEIKSNYNYPLNALMVTTKHSLPYYKEIVDEYIKYDLRWIRLRHLDSLGYASQNKSIDYSAEEYLDFWRKSVDYIVKRNKDNPIREGFIQLIMKKLRGLHANYTDFESPCGAVISQLAYSSNGDIYTCDEGRQFDIFNLGNVSTTKYKDLIKSNSACSMMLSSLNDSLMCASCVYKPYCGVCPVCNYAEENRLISTLPKNKRCKIYTGIFDYLFSSILQKPTHKKVFESWLNEKL